MEEWKILKNGIIYEDRLPSEDWAIQTAEEFKESDPTATFEVFQMTQEEIDHYENS